MSIKMGNWVNHKQDAGSQMFVGDVIYMKFGNNFDWRNSLKYTQFALHVDLIVATELGYKVM
jgi:hypothetical protein